MKKFLTTYGSLLLLISLVIGVTFAAFTDKSKILGSSFSVGSADLKLLDVIGGGISSENLLDEKQGPEFTDISPLWSEDYLVQLYNNATTDVHLVSNAYYETANDPDDLRQIIFVEPFEWDDVDLDGVVDDGELGSSLGQKSIVKWKTEGYDLGTLSPGGIRSLVLRFTTDSVPESKQGASALFDFEFESVGL